MHWLLLGIPAIASFVTFIIGKKKIHWIELAVMWAVSIAVLFTSSYIIERGKTTSVEWWGYLADSAYYDQPFEYWDTCHRQEECGEEPYNCGTREKPRTCYKTKYCDVPYACEKSGGDESFMLFYGEKMRISNAKYKELARRWKNEEFKDLHRERQYDLIKDGDRLITRWRKDWQTSEPIVVKHTYENRLRASNLNNFQKIDDKTKERYGLFDYPDGGGWGYEMVSILDQSGRNWKADKYFRYLNGLIGPTSMARLWVFIYRNQPFDASMYQIDYLKGANKNEIIVCIGANSENEVDWSNVITWSEKEIMAINIKEYINTKMKKLSEESLMALGEELKHQITANFVKPEFTDKYKNVSIDFRFTEILLMALILIVVCILCGVFAIKNNL